MASTLDQQFNDLTKEFTKLRAEVKRMKKQLNALTADPEKQSKKAPSGFAKPMKLSKELCKFLNIDTEEMMARTTVTKAVNAYVKEHGLQNPENKRELILDDKLKSIIKPNDGETVTFFNLQKYMSCHYIKEEKPKEEKPKEEKPKEEKPKEEKPKEEKPTAQSEPKKVKKIIKKVKK